MKKLKISIYFLLLAVVTLSCEKDTTEFPSNLELENAKIEASKFTSSAKNDRISLAKQVDIQKYQRVAKVMAANNLGKNAYFIEPIDAGYGIGIAKNLVIDWSTFTIISGEIAFFNGSYGKGDFWRQNPDGTVSVKLTTNQANAAYFNLGTGEFYFGTGNMNTKFTGTIEEFCYVDEYTGEEFCFTFLTEDSSNNAWVVHGNASVTLDGAGGDSRMLQMWWNVNPGDKPHIDFELK